MQRGLLLDIGVTKVPVVSQLLSLKDKSLLFIWVSLLDLDFHFYVFNRLGSFCIQSDCFTRRSVYKYLKSAAVLFESMREFILFRLKSS